MQPDYLCVFYGNHIDTLNIIDSLKKNGLYDNTVIVFTSEHGEMMGDHGMLEKRTLYEESARVPMLIKFQNQKDL